MTLWHWRKLSDMTTALPELIRALNRKLSDLELSFIVAAPRTVTAATTALAADTFIMGDATAGAFTITLPSAVGQTGEMVIKKIDASANAVTVDGAGAETIDGAATKVLAAQYDSVRIASDGANWMIV
jgi:hypothetical protein